MSTDTHVPYRSYVQELIAERDRLRQELSLAEEGLANYQQENERLKAERDRWKKRADELFFAESSREPQSGTT
jgi:FtsZ-binding cell division protein ZapB